MSGILNKAKNILYDVGDKAILPKYKTRRGGSVTPESEAIINDIINGISKLGEQDKISWFVVDVVSSADSRSVFQPRQILLVCVKRLRNWSNG